MSATASPVPVPVTSPARSVVVVGDDTALTSDAARILREGGFSAESRTALDAPTARRRLTAVPSLVLVVVGNTSKPAELIVQVAEAAPGAPVLLVVPSGTSRTDLRRGLHAGAAGIVFADTIDETLAPAAHAVAAGLIAVPPATRRQLAPRALSHREKEILRLVVEGYTNRQIASALFVAESTVKTHLSSAFGKLDTRSRAEAVALIMDPDEGPALGVLSLPAASEDPAGFDR